MKKFLSLLLALSMLLGCTAALAEEPETFSVMTMRWAGMGDSFTTNPFLVNLEKEQNIKVNWQIVSSSDWFDTQKPVLLAGGLDTLPDVFLGFQTLTEQDIINNVEYFLPLDDLIEEHMPNLKAAFEEMPALKAAATSADGHIYSLPSRMPSRPVACNVPVINVQWLKNLGLEIPTTLEELEAALVAFKEKDANGNGDPNDEIPYTGIGFGIDFLTPFGINDVYGTGYMLDAEGNASYVYTSAAYREGLKWAHKLYQLGVIDNELFTQDQTIRDAKCDDPMVSKVGFAYAWSYDAIFKRWMKEYQVMEPVAGPDGVRYAHGDLNGVYSIKPNQLAITKACDNPVAVLKWADAFYTGEASIQNFWGGLGEVTVANADGTYALNNPPEGVSADSWYWDRSLRDFGPKYSSIEFDKKIILDPTQGDGLKVAMDAQTAQYVTPAFPELKFTAEEYEELSFIKTDIDSYVETTRAKWITEGGIDEDWDAYVAQLNNMGLETMNSIYLGAYDRYLASLK